MLFNSLPFVFIFLPLTLAGYYLLIRMGLKQWIFLFLVIASLIFYAVWNPPYVLLLILSVLGNYLTGLWIERARDNGSGSGWALALGVAGNLLVLGWFKYANFFVDNANMLGAGLHLERIILPLAISFYTFQQIAFLVDVSRGEIRTGGIWRYATFVIFFPQLIAGPIVHYKEMMPQFFGRNPGRFVTANMTVGLVIFAIGLFKKTVIADSAAFFATPVFEAAQAGNTISLLAGWKAALAYTVQLYFDFSGYSDMAIGLARMFGIKLPVNFHSPLRAASIIEYWRRWHITLQQFIVSYMYQPLVLPLSRLAAQWRLGKWASFSVTVAAPTVVLFVVIGLWHGAAWTYVLFGLMHGTYLAINEFWRALRRKARRKSGIPGSSMALYHAVTLIAVIFANVMFRADSPAAAIAVWQGMIRLDQIAGMATVLPAKSSELITEPGLFLLGAAALIFLCPNTQQIMGRYSPILHWNRWRNRAPSLLHLTWRPTLPWMIWSGVVLFLGLAFILRGQSEFIYFNF
ncbi:MBOAT family O-acyltransferase [Ruegeria atlantica]|uniref:Probable alginate O-acetylase AlgI n=1 Tax=Ruegeria atlantica TaxID=81569 RepID=A0A0P1F2M8_9RHOB|nr:MBOAT family O-acyltransferase [Ruegeria atlantica]CUH49070.1 D-alanyl-lipoteichoic acid biosynthesis protein DltB [Ruegeria atlantica]